MKTARAVVWASGLLACLVLSASASAKPTTQPTTRPDAGSRAERAGMTLAQVVGKLALPEPRTAEDVELPAQARDLVDEAARLVDDHRAVLAIVKLEKALAYAPRSRTIHLALGRAHILSGNPAKAELHLAKALSLASDDQQAWYWLGVAQRELRQEQAATRSLLLASLATPVKPDSPVAVLLPYELGRLLDSQGYASAALPLLDKVLTAIGSGRLSEAQKNAPAIAALAGAGRTALASDVARLKVAAGQAAAGIGDLERLLAAGQGDRSTRVALLSAYVKEGRLDKAGEQLVAVCGMTQPADAAALAGELIAGTGSAGRLADLAQRQLAGPATPPRRPTAKDSTLAMVTALAREKVARGSGLAALADFIRQAADADPAAYVLAIDLGLRDKTSQANVELVERAVQAHPQDADVLSAADRFFASLPRDTAGEAAAGQMSRGGMGFAGMYVTGRLLAAASQPDKAVSLLAQSYQANKEFVPAYVERMKLELSAKRYDKALAVRDEAVKAGVKSAAVHLLAGRARHAQGKLREALDELRLAEQFDRENPEIVVELADAYVADGQNSAAMRRLRRLYEKDSRNLAVLVRLARVNALEGQFDEAMTYAQKAQALDPTNAEAGRIRGVALLQQGRVQQAIAVLQVVAREHPEDARCQLAVGQALVIAGRFKDAVQPLQKALALDQTLVPARKALADAFAKTAQLDDAFEQWKVLAEQSPKDMEVLGNLIGELIRRDQLEEAARLLERLTVGRDALAELLVQRAVSGGQRELAMKIIARQAELAQDPAVKTRWQRLKIVLLSLTGKRAEALDEAKKMFEQDPANMECVAIYVQMLLRARKADDAVRVAREFADKAAPAERDAAELYCDTLIAAKQHDKALALIEQRLAGAEDPSDQFAWKLTRVSVFQSARRKAEAVKAAKELYDADPAAIRSVLLYARILLWSKDYKTLLAVLDKAVKDNPAADLPQRDLLDEMRMDCLARLDRLDEMKKVFDAVLARTAKEMHSEVWYRAASIYSLIGKADLARKALEQALKLDPENVSACNDLGYQLADLGIELDRAEKLIRTAVSRRPETTAYLDSLAWVLYKRGRVAEAAEVLARVIDMEFDPDPVISDHFGDALYRLGRRDEAVAQWKASAKAREDDPDHPTGVEHSTLEKTKAKLKAAEQNDAEVPVAPLGEGVKPPGAQRT